MGDGSYYRVDGAYNDDLFTNGFFWYDCTTGARVTTQNFRSDHIYRLTVRLVPAQDDLYFETTASGAPRVAAFVNREEADSVYSWATPGAARA